MLFRNLILYLYERLLPNLEFVSRSNSAGAIKLSDIFDGFLWVQKRKRNLRVRWSKRYGDDNWRFGTKLWKTKNNLTTCGDCGSFHEFHTICRVCFEKINNLSKPKGLEAAGKGMEDALLHGCTIASSAITGYVITHRLIPVVAKHLRDKTKLHGLDMGKRDRPLVPESLGIVVGLTYLATFVTFFIVAPYILVNLGVMHSYSLSDRLCISSHGDGSNGYNNALSNIAAITSITAMLILGFIDDCYDLRWRYKIMFPFTASIPLLSVYYHSYRDRTTVLVPQFLARRFNLDDHLNLGVFYYIFMLMFVIFCTNAINIYAGINGLEVGQTIVLTVTVILYNIVEITTRSDCDEVHIFSLQILLPFLFCSGALYKFNRYPARVFVGDSYCYFAGMTLAVVGILGHFSEEILLFAIPQLFNFVLSVPQLFKFVPCPRHRLPKFNEATGLREPSTFTFKYGELGLLGRIMMKIYSTLGFAIIRELEEEKITSIVETEGLANQSVAMVEKTYVSNNLTLINLWLCWFGPRSERDLCHQLLKFQSWLSFLALSFLTVRMHHE